MTDKETIDKYPDIKKASYNRVCVYCGIEFTAHDSRKKYCSRRCKDIAIKNRKGIKCNTNTEPYRKICAYCGRSFETFRDTIKTCSKECSIAYRNHGTNTKRINTVEQWVNAKQDNFEYVSHNNDRIKIRCRRCGTVLERTKSTVRYRNVECEHCKEVEKIVKARQKMMCFLIALKDAKTPRKCECCGKTFTSNYHSQKYCSERCKKNGKSYRRRCRNYGVYYDPSVTRIKVVTRDKNICQICGKTCNPNDRRWGSLGPDFPTLDHVIPLARGGTHTWQNVQCACGMCNSSKRDLLGFA